MIPRTGFCCACPPHICHSLSVFSFTFFRSLISASSLSLSYFFVSLLSCLFVAVAPALLSSPSHIHSPFSPPGSHFHHSSSFCPSVPLFPFFDLVSLFAFPHLSSSYDLSFHFFSNRSHHITLQPLPMVFMRHYLCRPITFHRHGAQRACITWAECGACRAHGVWRHNGSCTSRLSEVGYG